MSRWFAKNDDDCSRLRSSLDDLDDKNSLPPAVAAHAASCQDCQQALDELFATRALLSAMPRHSEEARPWFAARVMAAIGEQDHLEFENLGEVKLKGFDQPRSLCRVYRPE